MEREEIFYSSMAKNKKVVVVVEEEELGRRRRRGQPQNYSNNRQALHYLQRARRAPHTHTHTYMQTRHASARARSTYALNALHKQAPACMCTSPPASIHSLPVH